MKSPTTIPAGKRRLTFKKERFVDIWMELGPLWRLHYNEIGPAKEGIPLEPDLARFLSMEQGNLLHIVTARHGTKLVGYAFYIVSFGLHYGKTTHSQTDLTYIHPNYRFGKGLSIKKSAGFRLLQAGEKMLDELKVQVRRGNVKLLRDFGRIYEALGYRPEEVLYRKVVPKDD